MIEIKDGQMTGTVEIPVRDADANLILKYGELEWSSYTAYDIGMMLGKSSSSILNSARRAGVTLKNGWVGKSGRPDATSTTARRIRMSMNAIDETQSDLARAIGASPSMVFSWVKEGVTPNREMLHRMAEHFNCTVSWLLGKDNNSDRQNGR